MGETLWQTSRRWAHTLRLGRRLRSFSWAKRLVRSGQTGGGFHCDADGRLMLEELDTPIAPGPQEVLLEGYLHALAAHKAGARFSVDSFGTVLANIGGVCCQVKTFDDLYILKEIYAEGTYGISGSGELLIFDIGMNVGHAALYFASRFAEAIVIGFEPFKPTFDRAVKNFAQNPALAERIHPNNYGLGASAGTMDVEFDPAMPGRMGVFGIPTDVAATPGRHTEQVILRDVVEDFDRALAAHPNRSVVMKVDCEGAEYDIISRLHEAGRLQKVQTFAIEWHRKTADQDPHRLVDMLTDSGFTVLCQGSHASEAGMIYGVNVTATRCEAMVGS